MVSEARVHTIWVSNWCKSSSEFISDPTRTPTGKGTEFEARDHQIFFLKFSILNFISLVIIGWWRHFDETDSPKIRFSVKKYFFLIFDFLFIIYNIKIFKGITPP